MRELGGCASASVTCPLFQLATETPTLQHTIHPKLLHTSPHVAICFPGKTSIREQTLLLWKTPLFAHIVAYAPIYVPTQHFYPKPDPSYPYSASRRFRRRESVPLQARQF